MAGRPRKPSMYDVAALAGVSHQTVSRVLNNHPSIRPQTRAKVLQAIEQVNYTPNPMARALATNRTHRIGVLIDGAGHYGPSTALRGFEEAARVEGYAVDAVSVAENDDPAAGVANLLSRGAEALCVIAPRIPSLESVQSVMRDLPVLVVTAGSVPDRLTAAVDQRTGARLAVEHLLALGHRRILHLAGPLDWLDALARQEAWRQRLTEEGLAVREPVVGDWSADFGYEFGLRSTEIGHATAIFVANDQMALGVIHGLHDRGLRVPQDISVVGFDDNPESRHFLPPLTTVRQDFHALGALSVTQLIAALRGTPAPLPDLIAPELMVRHSTAAPEQP